MSYPKIIVLPHRPAGKFHGRGRHSLGYRVVFKPTRKNNAFALRGKGYNPQQPTHKVWALPTRPEGNLEFRSITSPLPVTCVNCWTCDGTTPIDIVGSPKVLTTIDVMLDGFPGGAGCCDAQFGGIRYPLVACIQPPSWMWNLCATAGFENVPNCPVPTGLIQPAWWYGVFTGTYGEPCDPLHPGDLDWELELLLRTWCEEDMTPERYWASLQMRLWIHDESHPDLATSLCCMGFGNHVTAEGEGWASRWEACWEIAAYEMCGDFATPTPQLCACDDVDYPCDCVDFYLLEPE